MWIPATVPRLPRTTSTEFEEEIPIDFTKTYSDPTLITSSTLKDEIPDDIINVVVDAVETLEPRLTDKDFLLIGVWMTPSIVINVAVLGSL